MGIRLALGANGRRLELSAMAVRCDGLRRGSASAWETSLCTRLEALRVRGPGERPGDVLTVAALFLVVAAIPTYIPARRAARVDPTMALRAE